MNKDTAIRPALTAGEWEGVRKHAGWIDPDGYDARWMLMGRDATKAIALGNAMLPDGDPRQFTRADVRYLQGAVGFVALAGGNPDVLESIAARIDAILPPE